MPSDLIPLVDASSILGVSPERVRQLVVAGDLPGKRFGNAWAVPRDAVMARGHSPQAVGRPLGAVRAWQELVNRSVDLRRPGRYLRRASVLRCEMGRFDVESLPAIAGALMSGVHAAVVLGAPLIGSEVHDLYLPRSALDGLHTQVALVPDPLGHIRLRIVDDSAWRIIADRELAPIGAVALDLLESADPRHWIAAEELLDHA